MEVKLVCGLLRARARDQLLQLTFDGSITDQIVPFNFSSNSFKARRRDSL